MAREVKLKDIESVFAGLEYPVDRETVMASCRDVTVVLADGEENLAEIVANSSDEEFESPTDLSTEVRNLLPRHAVGEPYQSEGDA